jgi:hypothetical protein
MKKIILLLTLIVCYSGVNAQVDGAAIGLRLGWSSEIAYWHPINEGNRIEVDLGINNFGGEHPVAVSADYQWVEAIKDSNFNWFLGAGAGVEIGSNFNLGAIGRAGIEYDINQHFTAAADYKVGLMIINWSPAFNNFCLSVRYKF